MTEARAPLPSEEGGGYMRRTDALIMSGARAIGCGGQTTCDGAHGPPSPGLRLGHRHT